MNPQHIDWENKFGKTWREMDDDERWMAVLSTINELTNIMAVYQETIKCVATHKLYFKLIGIATGSVILPVLVWLIVKSVGG